MAQRNFGDIQKRIASVSAEIAKLQLEYTKLKNAGKSTEEIQKQLNGSFAKLTKSLTTLTNVTKQYNNQSSTTAKQATSANKALGQTSKQYATLSGSINGATSANKNLGQSFKNTFTQGTVGRIAGYLGIYQLLYAAISAVKDITFGSIKVFIDFQERLGRLGAVTGSTASELKLIESSIRSVAVETRFTAEETASLSVSLAKLGVSASDIPKLLGPIALAAQAIGESLDATGESIIKVSNQFGLSASESATTASTLVSAINESALSLNTFNTAIQYVGPIADQVGLTFEQTSAYMKELADNGFTASRIGTGLRSIFIELKESGIPLNDTLRNLAKENISVAEATDLVGKRAAAQLLSIIRNIDAIDSQVSAEERLTSILGASAAEMSTVAGQLKILKSAYNELQISIGESLTSSEFFLDVIGLISGESEKLARGYILLNRITTESSDIFKGELLNSIEGNSNAFQVLKKSVDSLNDADLSKFIALIEDKAYTENLDDVIRQLNIIATSPSYFASQQDDANAFLGAIAQIQSAIKQELISKEVRDARKNILDTYQPEIDAIEKIANLKQRDLKYIEEENKLQKKLEENRKAIEDAKFAEIKDESLIRKLEGESSGYQRLISNLADLSDGIEEKIKKSQEASKADLKIDKNRIELRRAEVREEIRQIKKIKDERIKEIEDRLQREKQAASTVAEAREAEQKAAQSIADANRDAQDALEETTRKTKELIDETLGLQIKYEEDFPDAFDNFSLSFEKILFDIQEAVKGATLSPSELADSLLGSANTLFAEYEQNLQELKDTLGDTEQGQLAFAEASKQQFEVLKGELDKLLETYNTYKASLTLESGDDEAANEILATFETAIAIIQNKVNQAGQAVDKTAEELAQAAGKTAEEIAKKTKENIQEVLVDGLGDALGAAIKALDKFNQVAFENTKDRIDREKEQVESRYELESDILKSQLDNQLITEEEYRNRQEKLRRSQIGEENTLDKSLFDAQQKRDRQSATSDYLQALASIVPNLIITDKDANPVTIGLKAAITSGIATASYGAELAAISQRKFIPKKFAEGGMVDGPSHAEGGVPFTVQGRGGYEMEGGEFVVNKRAAQLHRTILERINNSTRIVPQQGKMVFATGGVVSAQNISPAALASQQGSAQATLAQLDYLRAIAETNITISQNSSKPVRAYVSASDLQSDATERKIKERNTKV